MCVLAIAWDAHPRWRVVAIANRDERHDRPAAPLTQTGAVIAGRDLQSGGTWLGVTTAGRFAALTNLRGYPIPPDPPSRGKLVDAALAGEGAVEVDRYAAFNLVTVGAEATVLTNRPEPASITLAPGLHGVTNGPFDAPWPKTLKLQAMLQDWLARPDVGFAALFDALRDATPLGGESIFVDNSFYGTRCSTVVAIDRAGHGTIIERRFAADTSVTGETRIEWDWTTPA